MVVVVVFLLLLLLVLVVDDEDVKSRSLGGCGCGVLFFLSSFLSFYYKHKTKGTAFWRLTEDFLLSYFSLLSSSSSSSSILPIMLP